MSEVLYEIHYEFDLFLLIPFVLLVIPPILIYKLSKNEGAKARRYYYYIFGAVCFAISFSVCLVTVISRIRLHDATIGAYERGEYEIVEGYVENFVPMPYEGHATESFEIDGVIFEYSDYSITMGYHNAKSHGGVVIGDGQYLIIKYVCYRNENIILYIEEVS